MHSGFAALRGDCTMNVGVRVAPKPMSEALTANVARLRELFEEGLARFGGPWLAGAAFTAVDAFFAPVARSEEHTSELQSLMRISYADFCLKNKIHKTSFHVSNIYSKYINN